MKLKNPIFIIGCNRSGTTLLFRNMSKHPALWSLYIEAQDAFHRHWPIDPERGDRVTEPPSFEVRRALEEDLYSRAHNKECFRDRAGLGLIPARFFQRPLGRLYKCSPLRLIEKTPANSLRVPMLARAFPEGRFLFIVRRGEDVVSSLMEGWKNWSGTPEDGTWRYGRWHYLVPPGWRDMRTRSLEEICTFQWVEATTTAREDLLSWAPERHLILRHEDLIADPIAEYQRILDFCELPPSASFDRVMKSATDRVFTTGGSRPREDKWRRLHEEAILRMRNEIEPINALFYERPEIV